MILTGDPIDARTAFQHGLVNFLAAPGETQRLAVSLAERIARNAPLAVHESLQIARRANVLDEGQAQEASYAARNRIRSSQDFVEGARAFFEKRTPEWSGR